MRNLHAANVDHDAMQHSECGQCVRVIDNWNIFCRFEHTGRRRYLRPLQLFHILAAPIPVQTRMWGSDFVARVLSIGGRGPRRGYSGKDIGSKVTFGRRGSESFVFSLAVPSRLVVFCVSFLRNVAGLGIVGLGLPFLRMLLWCGGSEGECVVV